MGVSKCNSKVCIKGDIEPTPFVVAYNSDYKVNIELPIWQVNVLSAIVEKLENDKGCSVWLSNMV